jgi:transposase-like protein
MNPKYPFKWRHFQFSIILLCVRWYLRYPLGYRNLEEMMLERGLTVDHTTVYCWVQAYAPRTSVAELICVLPTTQRRVDETYIEVKGEWKYLYRAVDSLGNTLDFMLSAKPYARAAERFFRKVLKAAHNSPARVINVNKNTAYPKAIDELKADETLTKTTELRPVKYLNNIVEQDHRFIKRLVNPGMGCGSFNTARRTLRGYETMNMIRTRTSSRSRKRRCSSSSRIRVQIFGVVA